MEWRKVYYLWGAGANCYGALLFFNKEVIAVVDSNPDKIGKSILGVQIISFNEMLLNRRDETIVITTYNLSDEIVIKLRENNIYDYFICPYMASFYTCSDIIEKWNLLSYNIFAVYGKNPISDVIFNKIESIKGEPCTRFYINDKSLDNTINADLLLIVDENSSNIDVSEKLNVSILNLYDAIQEERNKDYEYLIKYKNMYRNQMCFLIGNGPSLRIEDLEEIKRNNIISIACNGIYLLYEETNWRPDIYVVGDANVFAKNRYISKESLNFIRNFGGLDLEKKENIVELYNSKGEKFYPGYPSFSNDLVKGVYGGRTVMFDMLQIAVYLGFNEIYLLGVDFSWGEDGEDSHFCKNYLPKSVVDEGFRYKNECLHAYISARNYAKENEINIFNATRGGHLEVFERFDFDNIGRREQ